MSRRLSHHGGAKCLLATFACVLIVAMMLGGCTNSTPTPTPTLTPTPAPPLTATQTPTPPPWSPRSAEDMKAYITPNDAIVQQKVQEILDAWWRWAYSDFEALRQWVADHVTYRSDSTVHGTRDYWQLPAETMVLGTGDCEDFAILFCSLLRAHSVPADSVYVAVGRSQNTENLHAYLVERWSTGEWQAMEPQQGTWQVLLLGDAVSFWSEYEEIYCFNDQRYIKGWPEHEYARYKLTGYPLFYTGRVQLKKYLTAGQSVSGSVIEVPPGDTSIWKNWGIEIKDPEGNAVFSKGGDLLQYSFTFTALQTGYYWIELWDSGYTKVVELRMFPADWEFIGGEHGSREAD